MSHVKSRFHGNRTNLDQQRDVQRLLAERSEGGGNLGIPGSDPRRQQRELARMKANGIVAGK